MLGLFPSLSRLEFGRFEGLFFEPFLCQISIPAVVVE
jgi:hypothetical protein